jgi:hypothetical protein
LRVDAIKDQVGARRSLTAKEFLHVGADEHRAGGSGEQHLAEQPGAGLVEQREAAIPQPERTHVLSDEHRPAAQPGDDDGQNAGVIEMLVDMNRVGASNRLPQAWQRKRRPQRIGQLSESFDEVGGRDANVGHPRGQRGRSRVDITRKPLDRGASGGKFGNESRSHTFYPAAMGGKDVSNGHELQTAGHARRRYSMPSFLIR